MRGEFFYFTKSQVNVFHAVAARWVNMCSSDDDNNNNNNKYESVVIGNNNNGSSTAR